MSAEAPELPGAVVDRHEVAAPARNIDPVGPLPVPRLPDLSTLGGLPRQWASLPREAQCAITRAVEEIDHQLGVIARQRGQR